MPKVISAKPVEDPAEKFVDKAGEALVVPESEAAEEPLGQEVAELERMYEEARAQTSMEDRFLRSVPQGIFALVGKYSLLSHEETFTLAQAHLAGRQAQEQLTKLAPEQVLQRIMLKRAVRAGQAAREKLIRHNLRLILWVVKRFGWSQHLKLEDLFQEGVIGLMHGIDLYDPLRGFRITTYVTWWVRQAMSRAISDKDTAIRVPVHVREALTKARRARRKIFSQGTEMSMAEALAQSGKSPPAIAKLLQSAAWNAAFTVSLEQPMGGGDSDLRLMDVLPAPQETNSDDNMDADLQRGRLARALEELSSRQRFLIVEHFLRGGTLETVGEKIGLTRERVRQLELRPLLALRAKLLAEKNGTTPMTAEEFQARFAQVGLQENQRALRENKSGLWVKLRQWRQTGYPALRRGLRGTCVQQHALVNLVESAKVARKVMFSMRKRGWIVRTRPPDDFLIVVSDAQAQAWYWRKRGGQPPKRGRRRVG